MGRAQSCLEMLTTTSIFVWASLLNFSLGIPNPSPFGPFLDNALNNMMNNRGEDYAAASMNPVMNKIIGADYGGGADYQIPWYPSIPWYPGIPGYPNIPGYPGIPGYPSIPW